MLAIVVAWITFRQARFAASRADIKAAIALLQGLSERFFTGVAESYFSTSYT
jgi:hypothetical protein